MNLRRRQGLCLLLMLWPVCLPAAGMDAFHGVWKGRVSEVLGPGQAVSHYAVMIQVAPGLTTVNYPGLGCRGVLLPRWQRGRHLSFRDKLDAGSDRCEGNGRTDLFLVDAGLAAYLWFDARGQLKVGGYLRRQQQFAAFTNEYID